MESIAPWSRSRPEPPAAPEQIEPNDEEKRNGWTAETLTAYVNESRHRQNISIAAGVGGRKSKPTRANGHKWQFRAR